MRTPGLALAGLALAAIVLGPTISAEVPMLVGAAGAGTGTYVHSSNSGFFVCPLSAVGFEHVFVSASIGLQAGGAPKTFGQAVDDFAESAYPCAMGTNVAFGLPDWRGNPHQGYAADRVTDLGPLAGITTERLRVSSFDQAPVHVSYWAQTVGGPAPSTWWVEADLLQARWS